MAGDTHNRIETPRAVLSVNRLSWSWWPKSYNPAVSLRLNKPYAASNKEV